MRNKFNGLLYKLKQFLIGIKIIIATIFFWQLFLTLFIFSATNFLILLILGIIYLLILLVFI
jgi:hypothetical protein